MSEELTHTPPPEAVQLSEILATAPVTVRVVAGVLMVRERERSRRLPETVSAVAYVAVWSPWIRSELVASVEVFETSRALPVVRAVAVMPETLVLVTVESMSNWASGVVSPMPTLPASVIAPVVQEKVFPVASVVFPFKDSAPVPVEKVPAPEIAKLPEDWVYPDMFSNAPALVSLDVAAVRSDPSERSRLAICEAVELRKVRVLVAAPVMSRVLFPPAQVRVAGLMVSVSVGESPRVVSPSTDKVPETVVLAVVVFPARTRLFP